MTWFSLRGRNLLHYGASHYSHEYFLDPAQRVQQDLATSGLTLDQIKGRKLIIDFRVEGQCNVTAEPLIQYAKTLPVSDILVVYNTVVDVESLSYRAVSHPTHLCNFAGWFDRMLDTPSVDWVDSRFLCLMRRPSVSRAKLAQHLLQLQHARFSFGSMCLPHQMSEYQSLLPGVTLPITIDGTISRESGQEHDQSLPLFKQCLFHIVVESSSQSDPGIWRSQFISEKSYKAFGLRQIPIWWAVPGLASNVRKLGFDMFDDIVDHSYDHVMDEQQRLSQIVEQLQQFNEWSLSKCGAMKQQLAPRFDNNYTLLNDYVKQCNQWYATIEREYDDH